MLVRSSNESAHQFVGAMRLLGGASAEALTRNLVEFFPEPLVAVMVLDKRLYLRI